MSVKSRLSFSVLANGIKALLSLILGMLVARVLGPDEYGNFAFLLGSFWAIRALLDMGSSSAFFTFISQGVRESHYYVIYAIWLLCQLLISVSLLGFLMPDSLIEKIWLGQSRGLILWALAATFLQNQVWQTVIHLYESVRKTTRVQIASVSVILVQLIIVLLFVELSSLTVLLFLKIISVEYALFAVIMCKTLRLDLSSRDPVLNNANFRTVVVKYYVYCRPLAALGMLSFVYEMADRWLLQRYGGADQQAFFQVAMQLSVVSVLVTTSILNVLWKELAESNAREDHVRVIDLYQRIVRLLLSVAMFFSCFLVVWAEEIVFLLLGDAYKNGWPVLLVMLFYPIHQSLGQINGTLFRAVGETTLLMQITVVNLLISLPLSFILIAPSGGEFFSGFQMGALGLAVKVVGINIIFVNIESWFISKRYSIPFQWEQQFSGVIVFIGMAYIAKIMGGYFYLTDSWFQVILAINTSGFFYVLMSLILVTKVPAVIGVRDIDIIQIRSQIKTVFSRSLRSS